MQKNVVIIGATSAICHEAARLWAKRGYRFTLVGRNEEKLASIQNDLTSYGAGEISVLKYDLLDYDKHGELVDTLFKEKVDILLMGHGTLLDQERAKQVWDIAKLEIESNFISYASILTRMLPKLRDQKSGSIGVITSVAGDRGRRTNYVYGSAKAGATAYVDGFRAECASFGVSVTTIKPGIIRTPMTAGLDIDGPLTADPDRAGSDIVDALDKGKKSVYTPGIWRLVMEVIKHIPSVIFDKMKI